MKAITRAMDVLPLGLFVNVGFTGHRDLKKVNGGTPPILPMENVDQVLADDIRKVLEDIKMILVQARPGALYRDIPPVSRFISCLAEGSDRIAVRCAKEAGLSLMFCLPFERVIYENDFSDPISKMEYRQFLSQGEAVYEIDLESAPPAKAYSYAGQAMVDHSDVLIAVWNGEDTGQIGGTSHVIEYARHGGIPVIWISASGSRKICIINDKGAEEYTRETLQGILQKRRFFLAEDADKGQGDIASLSAYWDEKESRLNLYAYGYRLFLRWFSPKGYKQTLTYQLPEFYDSAQTTLYGKHTPVADRNTEGGNKETLCTQFGWADNLAIKYSDIYRTVNMSRLILVFLSILSLCCGFYWGALRTLFGYPWESKDFWGNCVGFTLQLIIMLLIYYLENLNKKKKWHQKFMNYRMMAEMIRSARYLFPMGVAFYGAKTPEYNAKTESWTGMHMLNLIRHLGLPNKSINRESIIGFLNEFKGFIQDQKNFHQKSYHRYRSAALSFDWTWQGFFWFGVICVSVRVMFSWLFIYHDVLSISCLNPGSDCKFILKNYANLFALLFPALGAFAYALLGNLGWGKLRDRSAVMIEKLSDMEERLDVLIEETHGKRVPFERIKEFVLRGCLFIQGEVADWQVFVSTKPISRM